MPLLVQPIECDRYPECERSGWQWIVIGFETFGPMDEDGQSCPSGFLFEIFPTQAEAIAFALTKPGKVVVDERAYDERPLEEIEDMIWFGTDQRWNLEHP